MATLTGIGIFNEKKGPKHTVKTAQLHANGGIEGDIHAGDTERAISLMGHEVTAAIKEQGLAGFCTSKFVANLTTTGLDYSTLHKGDRLMICETPVRIEQVGKECFLECPIGDKASCPVRTQCAFGLAEKSGVIQTGDTVLIQPG